MEATANLSLRQPKSAFCSEAKRPRLNIQQPLQVSLVEAAAFAGTFMQLLWDKRGNRADLQAKGLRVRMLLYLTLQHRFWFVAIKCSPNGRRSVANVGLLLFASSRDDKANRSRSEIKSRRQLESTLVCGYVIVATATTSTVLPRRQHTSVICRLHSWLVDITLLLAASRNALLADFIDVEGEDVTGHAGKREDTCTKRRTQGKLALCLCLNGL
ncbi:hypothetical protein Efla_007862 [Eimeria flavescens]